MNKIRVIDLLNKIANGEEVPKEIHYNCVPLYWCEPCKIYETMTDDELCGKDLYTLLDNLNDEVEILEEKKKIPEKIEEKEIEISMAIGEQICANKINEIIDYLKSKGE